MDKFLRNVGIGIITFIAIFCAASGLNNFVAIIIGGINAVPDIVKLSIVIGWIVFLMIAVIKTSVEAK